jgi:hypothetical protein
MGGGLTQTVTVKVSGDFDPEDDEDFFVNLSGATGEAVILDNQGRGTILDDDTKCETFEDEAMAGLMAFSQDGIDFVTMGVLETGFFAGGGSTMSDYYLESDIDNQPYSAGSVGKIQIVRTNQVFEAVQMDLWLSTDSDANNSEVGDVTFIHRHACLGWHDFPSCHHDHGQRGELESKSLLCWNCFRWRSAHRTGNISAYRRRLCCH